MISKTMLVRAASLSLVLAGAAVGQANAASVFIKNASFEQDPLSDGGYNLLRPPTGWSIGGNAGWQNPVAALFSSVPDGAQTGFVGGGAGPARGALSQSLGTGVMANSTYTLSVDVGRRTDIPLDQFVVQLLSGQTVLASGTYTQADLAPGEFKTLSLSYDSTEALAAPLMIRFHAIGTSSDYRQVNFDNVKLDYFARAVSAVPEPSTWAMMIVGFGTAGSMVRASRRRNALAAV